MALVELVESPYLSLHAMEESRLVELLPHSTPSPTTQYELEWQSPLSGSSSSAYRQLPAIIPLSPQVTRHVFPDVRVCAEPVDHSDHIDA